MPTRPSGHRCRKRDGESYRLVSALPEGKRDGILAVWDFLLHLEERVDAAASGRGIQDQMLELIPWMDALWYGAPAGEFAAFQETVRHVPISKSPFLAYVDGLNFPRVFREYRDWTQFRQHAWQLAGGPAAIAGKILGAAEDEALNGASRSFGEAWLLLRTLERAPHDIANGRIAFPLSELESFGLGQGDMARQEMTESIRGLTVKIADLGLVGLDVAEEFAGTLPGDGSRQTALRFLRRHRERLVVYRSNPDALFTRVPERRGWLESMLGRLRTPS